MSWTPSVGGASRSAKAPASEEPTGHDVRAVVEEALDDGSADASAAAGDDCVVSFHGFPSQRAQSLICWTWAVSAPSSTHNCPDA